MGNRFNRPLSPEQVETLILRVNEAARARQKIDPHVADLMFKSLHCITMLWQECKLHDSLTETAEQVLEATQEKLQECLSKQSIKEAAEAMTELQRLMSLIKSPPFTLQTWADNPVTRQGATA